jgi:hypothetical protein
LQLSARARVLSRESHSAMRRTQVLMILVRGALLSMLLISIGGASLTLFLPQSGSGLAGALAVYLTLTAWMAIRRTDSADYFDFFALLTALCIVAGAVGVGLTASGSNALWAFVLAAIAAVAAGGDLRRLIQGPIRGKSRLTRHLWRLGAALLIATGSAATVGGSTLLFVIELSVLVSLIFWIIHLQVSYSTR